MGLLENFVKAGQTPWALAQHHNWNNPGADLSEQEMAELLGMKPSAATEGTSAATQRFATPPVTFEAEPQVPSAVDRARLPAPAPATEPTAPPHRRAGAGVLSGGDTAPAAKNETYDWLIRKGLAPEEARILIRNPRALKSALQEDARERAGTSSRPDFSNEPGGSEILGSLLQGAGGIVAPLGKMMMGSSDRRRASLASNQTYDWLLRQGTSPQDAEFIVRNPDVMKAVLSQKFGAGGTTDELKEYAFDMRQRRERGMPEPTFGEWKTDLKKSGRTQVTVAQGYEKEFDKKLAAQEAERYGGLIKAGAAARDMITNLDTVGVALDEYNKGSKFGTGALAPYENALRSYGAALGIGDAATVGAGELAQSVQNRMALMMRNPDGGMGMPGALSDADRKFLVASQPGIDKTPAGNRRMIEIMKRLEQRKIQISEMAAEWVGTNGTMKGFEQQLNKWANANPLFADMPSTAAQQRSGSDGAAAFAAPNMAVSVPKVRSDDDYAALPSGAEYMAPDGSRRRKH